jgi:hypothetical protein
MPVISQINLRTIHDYFHVIHKSVDHFEGLRDGHPTLLPSETVKPLQHGLDLALSQQLRCEFLCTSLSYLVFKTSTYLLNLPCLICLVARENTESNSTIIFTIISVIEGVIGISV